MRPSVQTPRIALAQLNPTVGDFAGNAARIRDFAARARGAGARLVCFPELAVCGYPPRDFLDMPEFLQRSAEALRELARPAEWSRGLSVVVGFPEAVAGAPPPGLYNAAALVEDGRLAAVGRKSLLPTYDVFDETRYFIPAASATAALAGGVGLTLGLSICEDIWNDKRFWDVTRYARDPIAELTRAGAGLVVNVSASPYGLGKPALRERMLGQSARNHGAPVAYVNQVGGADSLLCDGGSMLVGRGGEVLARAPLMEEALLVAALDGSDPVVLGADGSARPPAPPPAASPEGQAEEVFRALSMGLRDYVRKCGFRSAVVGLSGGIDSALTACLASLGEAFGHEPADLTAQNVQARVRGQILMAISNETGALVLSTGNKSELAVGYCTLYGDMAGGLAVIGDLPKTWVYRVARAANRLAGRALIPERTFTKVPSAELRPDQADQDTLPPYEVLDDILLAHVEERLPFDAIVARGHPPELVRRVLRMVIQSEYKRRQAAPVLKVSAKAFGEGRRFPIAHGWRP